MAKRRSQQQLLLLEDVDNLGRKGELVKGAKPGFIRNFLLPKQHAVLADKRTIRLQERLKEERQKQAEIDRKEGTAMANNLRGKSFSHTVKVDASGHMYGSVTVQDIVHILSEQGLQIERKMVLLGNPIRTLGIHHIPLRLKEGVAAEFNLRVQDEKGNIEMAKPAHEASPAKEAFSEEQEAAAQIEQEIENENDHQG
ncbi:MAG: 50S ribosomal protein L9 [Chlamydiia bacterium]|nr:50S ribosomal protein L9 [Chlamydiia bacterium]HPE84937.1 50S ribosomal protein L9 [Chlamydiales bacterium]